MYSRNLKKTIEVGVYPHPRSSSWFEQQMATATQARKEIAELKSLYRERGIGRKVVGKAKHRVPWLVWKQAQMSG